MKKLFVHLLSIILLTFCLPYNIITLKAQENVTWFYVGFCDDHIKYYTRCLMCGEKYPDGDHYVKVCSEHYKELTKYFSCLECNKSITHKAKLCSVCGEKDVCYICGKYLGSGDAGPARDKRKIVEQYTVRVTIPSKGMQYWNKAVEEMKKENYNEAINYFNKVYEIAPDGSILCQIGRALFGLEKYDEALEMFNRAIRESPDWADSYYWKGTLLFSLERYDEAKPLLKKAIDLGLNDEPALYTLYGLLLKNENQLNEAIKCFKTSIGLKPTAVVYQYLGEAYYGLEDYNEALKQYKLSNDLDAENVYVIYQMGNCYSKLNQFDKAEDYYKKALTIAPNSIEILQGLAELNFNQAKYSESIPYYEKIISLRPVEGIYIAYFYLGIAQYQIEQYEKARDSWKKSIETDVDKNPEPYSCLAVCEMKLNNPIEAEKCCEKAIELNKLEKPFNFYNLACAYSLMNKVEKSLLFLEKALKSGQVNISNMEKDEDLKNVQSTKAYKELLAKYNTTIQNK